MEIKKISASSYKTWNHCQTAFFIEQILNWKFPAGKAADFGTITHAILEILAQIKIGRQNNLTSVKTKIGNIHINVIDISSIKKQTYDYYINKEPYNKHKWTNKDFTEICSCVDIVLNHNHGQFNPLNRKILGAEEYIKLEIKESWGTLPTGDNLKITGFIDLITQIDENTIEIIDYKTAGKLSDFHTDDDINCDYLLNKDIQLRLYHLSMAEKYGCDKTYLLTMFFLKFSKPITITFSCDDIEITKTKVKDKIEEIYNTHIPKLNRTWKCSRFCSFGKNSFENSNIQPVIQFLDNGIAKYGQNCTICDQVNLEINRHGVEWVQNNLKKNS